MKVTRKELYDLVWAQPMTSLSKRFGLSDNGLRKHCISMNIPTPPNGYWVRLKYRKKTEIPPLPKEYDVNKQSTELTEIDSEKLKEIELSPPVNRYKVRESEISTGDTSIFKVPEILYAKDPIIIDTKEKLRKESENGYRDKNPFKSKLGPTLNIHVSEKSLDRALSIFATIIKALRFRGHNIKIHDNQTFACIDEEEIQIDITERRKRDTASENPTYYSNTVFCGELQFNILYGSWYSKVSYKDTTLTKIEDKIISIIAKLEIGSEIIKEDRIEAERKGIIREKEAAERKIFEERKKAEAQEFKSLFTMAERLHKTNILRQYINTYETFIAERGELNEEVAAKIQWAKEKADWLDPFISKEDKYLDYYDKDKIIQPECPKQNIWESQSYSRSSGSSFWSSPYSKWNSHR